VYSDRLIPICTTMVVSMVCAMAQEPSPPDALQSLIATATANNQELASWRTRSLEAKGLLRQAGVKTPFTVEASTSSGRPLKTVGEEEYSAGFSRTLETGGKRGRRVAVAEVRLNQVEKEYLERLRLFAFEIKSRYADALGESLRLKIFDDVIAANRRSLELTQARVAQGDAAQLDQTLLEVELARVEALKSTAGGRLNAALSDLRRLAALPTDSNVLGTTIFRLGPQAAQLESLIPVALEARADLRVAKLMEQLGEEELRLVEAEGRPDVTVAARYFKRNSQFDDQYGTTPTGSSVLLRDRDDILQVGVSVPILTKKRNAGNVEAAQARIVGARQRARFLEKAIPQEVEAAWKRWTASRESSSILESSVVSQSQKTLAIIQQAYQLGQLRVLDVLNEQRRVLDARFALLDSQIDGAKSFAELERAVGGDIQ
jgi:cobalt-zinc-cadmium efflux system outer membrane protein